MLKSDGFRTNLQLTSRLLRPDFDSSGKTALFRRKFLQMAEISWVPGAFHLV